MLKFEMNTTPMTSEQVSDSQLDNKQNQYIFIKHCTNLDINSFNVVTNFKSLSNA